MGLAEYQLRMEAYQLQQVAEMKKLHMQAFLNQVVKSTKGKRNPKPAYKTFNQFFNEEEVIDQVRSAFEPDYKPQSQITREKEQQRIFAKRLAEFHRLKKEGKIIPFKARKERR
jgi:hypothetical protein